MKLIHWTLILIASTLLLSSKCTSTLKGGSDLNEIILSDKGVFRGWDLDTTYKAIAITEKEILTKTNSEPELLAYNLPLGNNETGLLQYIFESQKLQKIHLESTFSKKENGVALINLFKEHYEKKYGPSSQSQGLLGWKVNQGTYDCVINFTTEDELLESKKLDFWIYKHNHYQNLDIVDTVQTNFIN